jgi:hypothetical protein
VHFVSFRQKPSGLQVSAGTQSWSVEQVDPLKRQKPPLKVTTLGAPRQLFVPGRHTSSFSSQPAG